MQLTVGGLLLILELPVHANALQSPQGGMSALEEDAYNPSRRRRKSNLGHADHHDLHKHDDHHDSPDRHDHHNVHKHHGRKSASHSPSHINVPAAAAESGPPALYSVPSSEVTPDWPFLGSLRDNLFTEGKMVNVCNQCKPCLTQDGGIQLTTPTSGECAQACLEDEVCKFAAFRSADSTCRLYSSCNVRAGEAEFSFYRKLSPANLILVVFLALFTAVGIAHCLCTPEDCEADAKILESLEAREAERRQQAAARAVQEAEERQRELEVQHQAACRIVGMFRRNLWRQQFRHFKASIVTTQGSLRVHFAKKEAAKRRDAAVCIQSFVRGRADRCYVQLRKAAVVPLQCMARQWLARRILNDNREQRARHLERVEAFRGRRHSTGSAVLAMRPVESTASHAALGEPRLAATTDSPLQSSSPSASPVSTQGFPRKRTPSSTSSASTPLSSPMASRSPKSSQRQGASLRKWCAANSVPENATNLMIDNGIRTPSQLADLTSEQFEELFADVKLGPKSRLRNLMRVVNERASNASNAGDTEETAGAE